MPPGADDHYVPGDHYHSPPLDPDVRAAIADAIEHREPVPSQRALAAEFGVSMSTIYRVAGEAGLADAWEERRHRTEAANAANAAELSARRNRLQSELLDDVQELRERLFGEVVHLHVVKRGESYEEVAQTALDAGPSDWRATMGAITGAVQQTINLARLESENSGAGAASNMLSQFKQALIVAEENEEKLSRLDELGP